MIKLQDLTPDVYYKESRDFQFIGRLYDLILNYVKTNSELINSLPLDNDTDDQLINLWASTLGFKTNKNYNIDQLRAVCSVFSQALKMKGSIAAIELIAQAILSAEQIKENLKINVTNLPEIKLLIPKSLSDINLLNDSLSYIIPVGTKVTIVRTTLVDKPVMNELLLQNKVNYRFTNKDDDNGYIDDHNLGRIITVGNTAQNIYSNNQAVQRTADDMTAVPGMTSNIKIVHVNLNDSNTNNESNESTDTTEEAQQENE